MRRTHTIASTLTGAVVLVVIAGPSLWAETPNATAPAIFRDCPACPEMVVVSAGRFVMGSPENEVGRDPDEGPQHEVTISRNLAVGKFEVTYSEWNACVAEAVCKRPPAVEGREGGSRPVDSVTWDEAKQYIGWLSRRTGKTYRLLSEAEWEYAARAGTTTPYPWGGQARHEFANYEGVEGRDKWRRESAPVGQFPPNKFGLFDMHGNVFEWIEDCWNDNYRGAPSDGSAWMSGDCSHRVLRGGSWYDDPVVLRSALRLRLESKDRISNGGFRVARTL